LRSSLSEKAYRANFKSPPPFTKKVAGFLKKVAGFLVKGGGLFLLNFTSSL
jgi:hypothetical protein